MILVVLCFLVALLTGFGAVQELIVPGIIGGGVQPAIIGMIGTVISVLFLISGIAMWRKWPSTRRLAIVTAVFSIVFHVYGALPPHRNMGYPALIIGVGFGLVLLIATLTSKEKNAEAAIG
jgi:tryptophan-rich sensory protein